ncbi:MAG TPA: S8 family peptidase [Actinomycetota bacterium]|nr:S8 family peptidase [Actinomycetota bacterium]
MGELGIERLPGHVYRDITLPGPTKRVGVATAAAKVTWMKKLLALLAVVSVTAASAPALGDSDCRAPCVAATVRGRVVESPNGRFVVGFDRMSRDVVRGLAGTGLQLVAPLHTIDAAVVEGPASAVEEVASWDVTDYVEPDARARFLIYQTSEQTGEGAAKAGRPPLPRGLTGKGVTGAVVDSGVDDNHPDVRDRVIDRLWFDATWTYGQVVGPEERDELARTVPAPNTAVTTHGLSVGGVLAGSGEAAQGGVDMEGVATEANIVDLVVCCSGIGVTQVAEQEGWGTDFLMAYDYMIRHRNDPAYPGGIRIATNQWGFSATQPYPREALVAILRKAIDSGIALIWAAGNEGPAEGTVGEPNKLIDEIVNVGASCPALDGYDVWANDGAGAPCGYGDMAVYSSRGPEIDLAAPVSGIWAPKYATAAAGNGDLAQPRPGASDPVATANNRAWYGVFGGTSAAAPYVAGVAALMLEVDPTLTPAEIEAILKRTARDFGPRGWDSAWGWGEVDAFQAAKRALRGR